MLQIRDNTIFQEIKKVQSWTGEKSEKQVVWNCWTGVKAQGQACTIDDNKKYIYTQTTNAMSMLLQLLCVL